MGSVWFDGADDLNRLSADLTAAGETAAPRARRLVAKTLLDVERDAKAFAPVDTGFLRSSIGIDTDPDGLGGQTGPAANYGRFVEYGTSRMAPHAYMGPALDRHSGPFARAIEQLGGEIL
jgi:HK97 gp10 family phage protein